MQACDLSSLGSTVSLPKIVSQDIYADQVRFDPELRKEYLHRCHQKHFTVAKVATARKLAIRMYWMLRTQTPYPQVLSSRVA
jgi:hypothetical protein